MRRPWKQIAATTLAVVFGIVAGIDVVGTPLAIIAINHAEHASDQAQRASSRAQQFSEGSNAATIRAREEDCRGQEQLRALGRKRIQQKRRELPATLRLLHLKFTPQVRALERQSFQAEEAEVKPVNCFAYGHEAQP